MAKRGKVMKAKRWTLTPNTRRQRAFQAILLATINTGTKRIAIFSVPKRARITA
jgi:hypothetical protein